MVLRYSVSTFCRKGTNMELGVLWDLCVKRARDTQRKKGEFKMVWFPNLSSLVVAGFHVAVLQCAAAAAWDSCQRYFGVISDRFAKDTRLRALLYISLV